jgi:type IV pilus assembly protein PilB
MPAPTKAIYPALVSRIKILSKMDIAEKRMPQDGTFSVSYETKVIDLRVSCLPLIYGEKIVIRILDQSRVPLDLSKMGYIPEELDLMRKGLNAPYGLVFLTGPTGSGKSTSLYGALNEIVSPELNVMTAEDPVEYKIDGINHVQVKPDIGLTFATVLRSFLRQDPDIILVGEVRDQETGEICLKAALTGHLVLSTLHTNDALSAVTRLEDMGLPSYLLASGLRLIIAQRLLRKLCPHCKEAYELTRKEYGTYTLKADIAYNAKGCEKCNFVGYKGRTPIAEVVLVNDDLRNLIVKRATISEMMPVAQKNGTLTLFQSGMRRVEEGITSVEEVMATAYE